MKNKEPFRKVSPPDEKTARIRMDPGTDNETIAWHIHTIDKEGDWGWHNNIDERDVVEEVLDKLIVFERMTWAEIQRQGSHSLKVADICKEAKKRLQEIRQDDTDELFSLRLSGTKRILGIRDRRILKILWWDPKHTVCPSYKKHT